MSYRDWPRRWRRRFRPPGAHRRGLSAAEEQTRGMVARLAAPVRAINPAFAAGCEARRDCFPDLLPEREDKARRHKNRRRSNRPLSASTTRRSPCIRGETDRRPSASFLSSGAHRWGRQGSREAASRGSRHQLEQSGLDMIPAERCGDDERGEKQQGERNACA